MRKDQIDRLSGIAEQVAEVFIAEADPNEWSGAGLPPSAMDEKTRGNRYWDKKNAIQTGTLLARVLDFATYDMNNSSNRMPEEDAEKEIGKYEKKAKELLNAIQAGASRTG